MAEINGSEWQTAGKVKTIKSKQTKPENAAHLNGNSVHHQMSNGMQNGYTNFEKRGSRQSSAGSSFAGKSKQNHLSNGQFPRPGSSKTDTQTKRTLLEKEAKNMAKYDTNREQIGHQFNEEIEKSRQLIRSVFEEIRKSVNDRERAMLEELEQLKSEGANLLRQQDQRSKDLKDGVTRLSSLNDRQIDDLRFQIRRFVNEQRITEELGQPMKFRYDSDRLVESIKNFGEVIAIGRREPQKHSSMSSLVSSADGDGTHSISGKSVTEIAVGGITMKSESMDADQLVELTRSLRENLKLQGITEDILPDICGSSGLLANRPRPQPPPTMAQQNGRNGQRR